VCTCDNGVEATGGECTTYGLAKCVSCLGDFFLEDGSCTGTRECPDGQHLSVPGTDTTDAECADNVCTCDNGVEATGGECTSNGLAKCASCSSSFYRSSNTCLPCTASGACPYSKFYANACDGTGTVDTSCVACTSNYHCNSMAGMHWEQCDGTGTADMCLPNVCTCDNGVEASGSECTNNLQEQCVSCSGAFFLEDGRCTGHGKCDTGQHVSSPGTCKSEARGDESRREPREAAQNALQQPKRATSGSTRATSGVFWRSLLAKRTLRTSHFVRRLEKRGF